MEAQLSSQDAIRYLESLGLFLTDHQREQWQALPAELAVWNAQINVVSRKDMEHAAERHLLHSACLAPILGPLDGQRVVDGRRMVGPLGADGLQRDGLRAERGQNFGCWGERMRVAERHQTLQSQDVHFVRQAASQRAWAWAHLVRRWAVVCVNSRCKGSVLAN